MVPAEQKDIFGEIDFEGEDQEQHLGGEHPSVDIVTQKQISVGGGIAPNIQNLQKIVILPMNVTHDSHGVLDAE